MKGETGAYLEPCRYCGELVTVFDGQRVYWPEGFPHVHECPLPLQNERSAPLRTKTPSKPVQASIQAVPADLGGVPL